eukprot:SAG11_NODE_22688_length_401_cov_3.029801_1_plen_70_part_00
MNKEEETNLSELHLKILNEIPFIDEKPYSHNIIAMTLQIIEDKYGEDKVIETMKNCRLDKYGWCIPSYE